MILGQDESKLTKEEKSQIKSARTLVDSIVKLKSEKKDQRLSLVEWKRFYNQHSSKINLHEGHSNQSAYSQYLLISSNLLEIADLFEDGDFISEIQSALHGLEIILPQIQIPEKDVRTTALFFINSMRNKNAFKMENWEDIVKHIGGYFEYSFSRESIEVDQSVLGMNRSQQMNYLWNLMAQVARESSEKDTRRKLKELQELVLREYLKDATYEDLAKDAFASLKDQTKRQVSIGLGRRVTGVYSTSVLLERVFPVAKRGVKALEETLKFWSGRVGERKVGKKGELEVEDKGNEDEILAESDLSSFTESTETDRELYLDLEKFIQKTLNTVLKTRKDLFEENISSDLEKKEKLKQAIRLAIKHYVWLQVCLLNRNAGHSDWLLKEDHRADKDKGARKVLRKIIRDESELSTMGLTEIYHGSPQLFRYEVDYKNKQIPSFQTLLRLALEVAKDDIDGKIQELTPVAERHIRDVSLNPNEAAQKKDKLIGPLVENSHFVMSEMSADEMSGVSDLDFYTIGGNTRGGVHCAWPSVHSREELLKITLKLSHSFSTGMEGMEHVDEFLAVLQDMINNSQEVWNEENDLKGSRKVITLPSKYLQKRDGYPREKMLKREFGSRLKLTPEQAKRFYGNWLDIQKALNNGDLKKYNISFTPQDYWMFAQSLYRAKNIHTIFGGINNESKNLGVASFSADILWMKTFLNNWLGYGNIDSLLDDKNVKDELISAFVLMFSTGATNIGWDKRKMIAQLGAGDPAILATMLGALENLTSKLGGITNPEMTERASKGAMNSQFVEGGGNRTSEVRFRRMLQLLVPNDNDREIFLAIHDLFQSVDIQEALKKWKEIFSGEIKFEDIKTFKEAVLKDLTDQESVLLSSPVVISGKTLTLSEPYRNGIKASFVHFIVYGPSDIHVHTAQASTYVNANSGDRKKIEGTEYDFWHNGVLARSESRDSVSIVRKGQISRLFAIPELALRQVPQQVDPKRVLDRLMQGTASEDNKLLGLIESYLSTLGDFEHPESYSTSLDNIIQKMEQHIGVQYRINVKPGRLVSALEKIIYDMGKDDLLNLLEATNMIHAVLKGTAEN